MPAAAAAATVCVTGAGGFIASWLVKLLLQRGYTVKGTVRNPDDPKNEHLRAMDGAADRLILCKADLLDFAAIHGCHGVFHTASPVTDDPEQMVEPAVRGTRYVVDAAAEAGVRRVVFTSSVGAVTMDPSRGPEVVVDESCWSDLEFCKATKNWYCYGKVVAERAAVDLARERGVDLVVVCPVLVLGPPLHPGVNASLIHVLKYLDGSACTYANAVQAYVHVRDVADALLRVYEAPSAAGRYLCAESVLHRGDVVRILGKLFPEYPVPTSQMDSQQSSEVGRANWRNTDTLKFFLESCVQEVSQNGRQGGSLKLDSWERIRVALETTFGVKFTQRQLKNHYDYLKDKYQAWVPLTKKTGNIYNPETHAITMTSAEWEDYIKINLFILAVIDHHMRIVEQRNLRTKKDNSSVLSGHAYTKELLSGSDRQCIDLMRMNRTAFIKLCFHFRQKGWLQDSKFISVEEKMAMFLTIIGQNERYAVIKRRFQHSLDTINVYFHEVLTAMLKFAREVIVPSNPESTQGNSTTCKRLRRIFKGAIGALDGTLIHAVVPLEEQTLYRGRGKGECYQNVLGVCDFNLIFTYVWAGWEGVAHDSRVLREVAGDPESGFVHPPPDKYYLCDAAYPNTRGFLAPYRNARYWLADFRRRRPVTKEEKFNHAHAQLRNVIERAFGVLKARFAILRHMSSFPFDVQRDIVYACVAVHNFLRKESIEDELFASYEQSQPLASEEDGSGEEHVGTSTDAGGSHWSQADQQFMQQMRDNIALQLMTQPE